MVDEARIVPPSSLTCMDNAAFNRVQALRQRNSLSEDDLAFLIDVRSHTTISRIEAGLTVPKLYGALALQVLFRQTPSEMFPDFYEAVEEEVMRRAKIMFDDLDGLDDRQSAAKRTFLEGLAREDRSDEEA